ncbi:hypothetical protein L6164_022370 [Bauhinia variegata]|uniref:Uncharacterized protein n=1 Tax=Bauhinia variegata TaxID=167791 RepID=A0ACB9MIB4_BAUVA|nr:hypothetical protein L6164_022370 [Bauhinia variegata]
MAVAEETGGTITMIDETYEFSAPRFFDFILGESEEDMCKAELWFETALSYAPSPFMPKIKAGRSIVVESLCDFSDADKMQKTSGTSNTGPTPCNEAEEDAPGTEGRASSGGASVQIGKDACTHNSPVASQRTVAGGASVEVGKDACTPNPPVASQKTASATNSKKQQTAKKIAGLVKNPTAMKTKSQRQSSAMKNPSAMRSKAQLKSSAVKSSATGISHLAQENQAIKRQKLEGGRTRQILNVKPQILPHKSKPGSTTKNASVSSSSTSKTHKEDRKIYVRETPTPASVPFVSMAEMMKRFQSSTRDLSLPNANSSLSQMKPKLTLTRPKEPEFETSQRARSVRMKSSAELEEEMMAKMPKFKARPLNKKILQAPALPPVPRSTPKPPEFREFHLETMSRAHQDADSTSVASTEVSYQGNPWKPHLTEPKTPLLQTSLRARPAKVKSSLEIEQEELEKIPKFKARPLNKKIFESKGDIGIFCHAKKHVTQPQEFHFATNDRIPPPASVADLFAKLSLKFQPTYNSNPIPRNTTPNPFHLHTEERGAEKEKKLFVELMQKQWEEERARIPKANPYPYTTDYPVIPPKPEPKQWTKPEPFQLESLIRHEEEMQREMEERQRMEREEAQKRIFKAQPILKEDPIPVPEKVRKPLTQVQEFDLNVDHRALDRAEFDQKIKDKEMMYKRYREESEAAKMMEEEKALKQLRRTLVHHARPVPKFDNPFCPQKSCKEATKPKSPHLRILHRKERRKIFNGTAVSSPAASMR